MKFAFIPSRNILPPWKLPVVGGEEIGMNTNEQPCKSMTSGEEVSYAKGPLSSDRERAKWLLMELRVHKADAADLYVRVLSSVECAKLYKRLIKPAQPLAGLL